MGNTINKPKPSTDPAKILIELAIVLDHPRFHLNFRASLEIPQFLFKREYSFNWIPPSHADETEQENLQQNVQGEGRSLAPKSRSVFSDVPLLECTGSSSPILEVNSATQNLSFLSEEEDPGSLRSAKNICRVCSDNMKASTLIATVSNAKDFVLNTFKENMVSSVLKCKDICRVQFNNMMCKGDSVTKNVKLPTSSFISTVLNAANNSSVNQLECSSVSITVHDKNLRKLIRKRTKISPFQCHPENYPSANNNSWEELGEESTSVFSNVPLNQCAESSLPILEVNSATKNPYFLSEELLERVYLGLLRSGYSDLSRTSKSISFRRILTGDAGVQRHNSARNICRILFGNMQSTEDVAFNSVNQNEELQSSPGSVTVPNAKQSELHSSPENDISGVLECKSICRLLLLPHFRMRDDLCFILSRRTRYPVSLNARIS